MAKAPSFQWYPKDCDTDENVRAMDDREFGFYIRCLNHSWLNGGLPGDLGELARVLGRTRPYVSKIWDRVGRCFELQGSRYFNLRQEEQRKSAREFVESRRIAAETRWGKREQSTSNARALHLESSPSASPSAYPTTRNTHTENLACAPLQSRRIVTDMQAAVSERFEEFWQQYPRKQRRDFAGSQWVSVVNVENEDAVFACLKRYNDSDEVARGVVANPDKWLYEQHRNGWSGDWPARSAPQKQRDFVSNVTRQIEESLAKGESPW